MQKKIPSIAAHQFMQSEESVSPARNHIKELDAIHPRSTDWRGASSRRMTHAMHNKLRTRLATTSRKASLKKFELELLQDELAMPKRRFVVVAHIHETVTPQAGRPKPESERHQSRKHRQKLVSSAREFRRRRTPRMRHHCATVMMLTSIFFHKQEFIMQRRMDSLCFG
jgi:hypothetical protein